MEVMTILRYPVGFRNKGLITQKSEILRVVAQFSRYEVQTSQTGHGFSGAGRGWVDDSTVPQGPQKLRVNHSKNGISACIRTVFKI